MSDAQAKNDSSVNVVYYKPTLDLLNHMVQHESVKGGRKNSP